MAHTTQISPGASCAAMPNTCDGFENELYVIDDTVSFMPTDIKVMYSTNTSDHAKMIDNSRINYVPIHLRCGVVAMCRTNVLTLCPAVLKSLNKDLIQCLVMMPPSVHALIKRTRIWVNLSYSYGHQKNPRLLKHTTAHHHDAWLLWARDRPDKVHGIEIYDCRDYLRMRLHWNGAGLICHELCHLIHQFALSDGLQNSQVVNAYLAAKASNRYNKTLRRDWAGCECDWDLAYAMVDHKEFFAEMSVAYLCDTYPEFDKEDSSQMECCSPPYLEPNVIERVRQQKASLSVEEAKTSVRGIPTRQLTSSERTESEETNPAFRFLQFLLNLFKPFRSKKRKPLAVSPCNKFYPFTRGQLKEHDADLYAILRVLWQEIELWDDPMDNRICAPGFGLLSPLLPRESTFQID